MHLQHNKGFTLIELIVALGIFSVVITIVAGTYFSLVSASTEMRASTSAINNVTSALNLISDDIRSGTCASSSQCVGGNSFTFTNSSGIVVTYSKCGSPSQMCKKIGNGTQYALTHTPVSIKGLSFAAQGYSSQSFPFASQTLTIIRINGQYKLPRNKNPANFHLETVVTPRKIYIQ